MYFCQDVDLLAWEPGIFVDAAFAHQAILKDTPAILTGTSLVLAGGSLAAVAPGMVVQATLADGSLTQMLEVVTIADNTHATVSALRGRSSENAIAPLTGGSVKITVITFRPQIAAVGDALLSSVGITSDRDTAPTPAYANLGGFRAATLFGTLAAIYRTLVEAKAAGNITFRKQSFYDGLAQAARQTLAALVDRDGDGIPETRTRAAVRGLERV